MRIDPNAAVSSELATQRSNRTAQVKNAAAEQQDRAQFSADSVALSALQARAMDTPEVRQERVAALREAIQTGKYQLDAQQIADAMLRDMGE